MAADGRLRVYDLPAEVLDQISLQGAATSIDTTIAEIPDNLPAVLYIDEGETVYDYAWYPGMLAAEPASCVFASTARVGVLTCCCKYSRMPQSCIICGCAGTQMWHACVFCPAILES
jgi:hypothetical protein